jgi:4-aminobutyrate aminotransferase-like enzyme
MIITQYIGAISTSRWCGSSGRSVATLALRRGKGQYLYDRDGNRDLELLSGFGVFAVGRNHPVLCEALKSVLDSDLPNLVEMDLSTLAGISTSDC